MAFRCASATFRTSHVGIDMSGIRGTLLSIIRRIGSIEAASESCSKGPYMNINFVLNKIK